MVAVIRIFGLTILDADGEKAIDTSVPEAGRYVTKYNASGGGGQGVLLTSPDRAQAHEYPSPSAAAEAWRAQSTSHPYRPGDGGANRPLTAFTIEVLP